MRHTHIVARGVNVEPTHLALLRNPTLWNRHRERLGPKSPHRGVDDIWVRFNDIRSLDPDNIEAMTEEHDSVWYPAYQDLRCLDDLIFPLMAATRAERLGGVLITRIPPGKMVRPHIDSGWHSTYYDKYAIQIAANSLQGWHNTDGTLVTQPGDVFWFNNQVLHAVTNESNEDRITLIVCLRLSKT